MSDKPEDIKRAETRAKLKAFLQSGDSDDVASVLVHTLMHRADVQAENTAATPPEGKTTPPKDKKK